MACDKVWRLIRFKYTLCYKVLSSKYFPNGDVFRSKMVDKPSYTWSSNAKNFVKLCPRCKAKEETLIHALKDCPSARAILTIGGLDNRLIEGNYSRCIDWLEDVLRVIDLKATADFFKLLWNSWNCRNNFMFKVIPATPVHNTWLKPPDGYVKINFDVAVSDGMVGFGVIARDSDGFVISGSGGFKEYLTHVEWDEMEAFEESLKVAIRLKEHRIKKSKAQKEPFLIKRSQMLRSLKGQGWRNHLRRSREESLNATKDKEG
ncbi:hypothetical protein CXB51_017851 [Gossypium anomalum]|uniref:RNase H type-1 domain-containing protein n=1 Tax=Gossypium anomalum TaxID=47600 RepID=A0A8J5YFP1_9ROSI|nr:hypothetical protein CXB51_017851 [Gossypium anomalum]